MTELVLCPVSEGIATLTFNRPETLNALSYALIDGLMARLDAIETDASIRAVILTGAGKRAFSAGGDIHEFSGSVTQGANAAVRDFVRRGQAVTARLEAFTKPVMAAVNGIAFGRDAKSPRRFIWRLQAKGRSSPSPRSISGCPPPSAGSRISR